MKLYAQPAGPQVVFYEPVQGLKAHRGAEVSVPLKLVIRGGYHINSNAPAEEYLIPTLLTWSPPPGFTSKETVYPKAESLKSEFSGKPLLVYSGAVTVTTRLAVVADAPQGNVRLTGKLRYQACTDKMCLAPRTVEVSVPVTVE